jgi:hypothetical protein
MRGSGSRYLVDQSGILCQLEHVPGTGGVIEGSKPKRLSPYARVGGRLVERRYGASPSKSVMLIYLYLWMGCHERCALRAPALN